MAHKFNPQEYWKLETPERKKLLPPIELLQMLGLSRQDVFVDIGCGIGYFTIPALEILDPEAVVYALDTSELLLDELSRRLKKEQRGRVRLIKTGEYDLKLEPESASFAFMSTVLHEIDDRPRFLREVWKLLVPDGRLAVIEWEKKSSEVGPHFHHRIGRDEVEELLTNEGFFVVQRPGIRGELYGIVGLKSSS
jgi:ubiquinone/menaquinone biosynthesis C-methylase UbiE